MKNMAETLRKYKFDVQCVIRRDGEKVEVLDILGPEEDVKICGLAVDIGTTSVAALIIDMRTGAILAKASTGNGQIRYGADVINRIIEAVKPAERKSCRMRSSRRH